MDDAVAAAVWCRAVDMRWRTTRWRLFWFAPSSAAMAVTGLLSAAVKQST